MKTDVQSRAAMATSKTRDFFSWMDDEVELLLHTKQEYIDRESSQSK